MKIGCLFTLVFLLIIVVCLGSNHAQDAAPERVVRVIYFFPIDRPFSEKAVLGLREKLLVIKNFYADQMRSHGYGGKTFNFETDALGEPLIHRCDGRHPNSYYLNHTLNTMLEELRSMFDFSSKSNIYFLVINNGLDTIGSIGVRPEGAARISPLDAGVMLVPNDFNWVVGAHEIGHTFGMSHDFNDNRYLMSYGGDARNQLSACHARFLDVHPYFNPDLGVKSGHPSSVELVSSREYQPDVNSVAIRLKVSDADGLHQVILLTDSEVKTCHALNGETEAIVQFDYDGLIPSNRSTSLANSGSHPISVQTVDITGGLHTLSFVLLQERTGGTLRVSQTGRGEYRSISAALRQAKPFDEILVLDNGTYAEEITISTHDIILRSADDAQPILEGALTVSGVQNIVIRGLVMKQGISILNAFAEVRENSIIGSDGTAIAIVQGNAEIHKNTIMGNRDAAIFILAAKAETTITQNILVDNGIGIVISNSPEVTLINNLIARGQRQESMAIGTDNSPIFSINNTLIFHDLGINILNGSRVRVINTLFAEMREDIFGWDNAGAGSVIANSLVSHQALINKHQNIIGEPAFINSLEDDFRLAENSSAIDRGTYHRLLLEVDLDGQPRITQGVVDIGAYEYQPVEKEQLMSPAWDVNEDGLVDIRDLIQVVQYIGENDPANPRVDVNGDGTVNILDLTIVSQHFGEDM